MTTKKPFAIVVQDDKHLSEAFKTALEDDFIVEIVYRGQGAMEMLRKEAIPDLVVLDVGLVDRTGEAVLEFIVNETRLNNMAVLAIAPNDHVAKKIRAIDRVARVLQFPVGYQELKEAAVQCI